MQCYMDQTADPCDRFFDYACGRWSHHHPIPNDKGGYDTFEILREDLSANLIQGGPSGCTLPLVDIK